MNDYFAEEIPEDEAKNGVQPKPVYYVSDEGQQAQYISMFKDAGVDAVVCDQYIDPHFISYIEYKNPKKCRFVRIDADLDGALKSESELNADDYNELVELFKTVLSNKDIAIKVEKLKSGKTPAVVNVDEFMRRMTEMNSFYGMGDFDLNKHATLVLNATNPIVSSLLSQPEEKRENIVYQIYYLAMIAYKKLSPEELFDFTDKTAKLLFEYSK